VSVQNKPTARKWQEHIWGITLTEEEQKNCVAHSCPKATAAVHVKDFKGGTQRSQGSGSKQRFALQKTGYKALPRGVHPAARFTLRTDGLSSEGQTHLSMSSI